MFFYCLEVIYEVDIKFQDGITIEDKYRSSQDMHVHMAGTIFMFMKVVMKSTYPFDSFVTIIAAKTGHI